MTFSDLDMRSKYTNHFATQALLTQREKNTKKTLLHRSKAVLRIINKRQETGEGHLKKLEMISAFQQLDWEQQLTLNCQSMSSIERAGLQIRLHRLQNV